MNRWTVKWRRQANCLLYNCELLILLQQVIRRFQSTEQKRRELHERNFMQQNSNWWNKSMKSGTLCSDFLYLFAMTLSISMGNKQSKKCINGVSWSKLWAIVMIFKKTDAFYAMLTSSTASVFKLTQHTHTHARAQDRPYMGIGQYCPVGYSFWLTVAAAQR